MDSDEPKLRKERPGHFFEQRSHFEHHGGKPPEHSPFCEDDYYYQQDESDFSDAGMRIHKKSSYSSQSHSEKYSTKKSDSYRFSEPTHQERKNSESFFTNQPETQTTKKEAVSVSKDLDSATESAAEHTQSERLQEDRGLINLMTPNLTTKTVQLPARRNEPERKPEPYAEEEYIAPPKPERIRTSAIGAESSTTTNIADESQFHKRYITQHHTSRVFKLADFTRQPAPSADDLPFTDTPQRPHKSKSGPTPIPKRFEMGEFRDSDYEGDEDIKIRPKWQPADSESEDPYYGRVEAPKKILTKKAHQERKRTPTPPSLFEVPPEVGGPLRPTIEPVLQYDSEDYVDDTSQYIQKSNMHQEIISGNLDADAMDMIPGTEYVLDTIKVESRQVPPVVQMRPTFKQVPYKEVIERTEKIFRNEKIHEEVNYETIRKETKSTTSRMPDGNVSAKRESSGSATGFHMSESVPKRQRRDEIPMSESDYSDVEYRSRPIWCRNRLTPDVFQNVSCPMLEDKPDETSTAASSDIDKPVLYEAVLPEIKKIEKVQLSPLKVDTEVNVAKSRPNASYISEDNFYIDSHHEDSARESKFMNTMSEYNYNRKDIEIPDEMSYRERRESLDDYSVAKLPQMHFKTADEGTEIGPTGELPFSSHATGAPPAFNYNQDKVESELQDMTQQFRRKAHEFADQLVEEVLAGKESTPSPSLMREESTPTPAPHRPAIDESPVAYRDDTRTSEYGTKHIDPDTGLIYFKYDFGYEFGILLPGEGVKNEGLDKDKKPGNKNKAESEDPGEPFPVVHIKTSASQ